MTKLVIVLALVALFTISAAMPQVNVVDGQPDAVHVVDGQPDAVQVIDGVQVVNQGQDSASHRGGNQ